MPPAPPTRSFAMTRSLARSIAATSVWMLVTACAEEGASIPEAPTGPEFTSVQPELFSTYGAQPNAWADYDLDGDLDLFVGFRPHANRLYRNDGGVFVDVAK